MQLYLLRREPFESALPIYDCNNGFVIRAKSAAKARMLASRQRGDEGSETWLSSHTASCIELTIDGPEEVVLRDFNAG